MTSSLRLKRKPRGAREYPPTSPMPSLARNRYASPLSRKSGHHAPGRHSPWRQVYPKPWPNVNAGDHWGYHSEMADAKQAARSLPPSIGPSGCFSALPLLSLGASSSRSTGGNTLAVPSTSCRGSRGQEPLAGSVPLTSTSFSCPGCVRALKSPRVTSRDLTKGEKCAIIFINKQLICSILVRSNHLPTTHW